MSNFPFISKLLGQVVAEQLTTQLNHYDHLGKFQAAYRPGHICSETAHLRLMNDVPVVMMVETFFLMLLGLSTAFDTTDLFTLLRVFKTKLASLVLLVITFAHTLHVDVSMLW